LETGRRNSSILGGGLIGRWRSSAVELAKGKEILGIRGRFMRGVEIIWYFFLLEKLEILVLFSNIGKFRIF
jgi:hypothetical protein